MEKLQIKKEEMINLMIDIGYYKDNINQTRIVVDCLISFLNKNSLSLNSKSVSQFVDNYFDSYPRLRSKENATATARKAAFKFLRFVECGELNERYIERTFKLSGSFSDSMNSFIEDEYLKLKKSTLYGYKHIIHEFHEYLVESDISKLSSEIVVQYFIDFSKSNTHPHPFYQRTIVLKKYFKYSFENGYFNTDFSAAVPKAKYQRSKELPSVYSNEEIKNILNTVDRSSDIGKRDYAVLTLAVYLGLRAGDIAGLKFENIDWERSLVTLTLHKTDKEITLPLLPEVGNAILDYLKNSRRNCDLDVVFISCKNIITPITSTTIYNCVSRAINKTGIDIKGRKKGPHALRHSLATRLLKQGQPLPVISEVLGHSDTQVTTFYTSIDFEALKECALTVLPLKSKVYEVNENAA